jgi:hypothetical protein
MTVDAPCVVCQFVFPRVTGNQNHMYQSSYCRHSPSFAAMAATHFLSLSDRALHSKAQHMARTGRLHVSISELQRFGLM